MKMTKKFIAMLLAVCFVFSAVSLSAFADDAIESPIIPVGPTNPSATEWYEYEFDAEAKTAILTTFNPGAGRTNVTVRAEITKDSETYKVIGVAAEAFKGTDIKSVVIQDGVTTIGKEAFANCASLSSVEFADSLTEVDETAFDGTAWINNLPDGVTFVGKIAYKVKGTCEANISLPADTVAVAAGAFRGQTSLEKIIIPEATAIGTDAFAGCTAVTFYCYENSPAQAYAVANGIEFVLIPSLVLEDSPAETYQNEELDLTAIKLTYISAEGETPVTATNEMVTGFDPAVLGEQTVTVSYNGKSVTFKVTVVERPAYKPGDLDGNDAVDLDDAIYYLFHVNFPEFYPVNQPVNFDNKGEVDLDDAIYFLFHVNFPEFYPLFPEVA